MLQVPTLRYTLTSEDYEKDRASEMKRVEQMLDDVEEAHAAKTGKGHMGVSRGQDNTVDWS